MIRRFGVGLVGLLVLALGAGCAGEYLPQPEGWLSYIECYDGGRVYDDEVAALAGELVADREYGSLVFVFTQCFSGGMLDDLEQALQGTGDVALMSASRHDELAWRAVTTDSVICLGRAGLKEPQGYFASVVARGLARTGEEALSMLEVWELARDDGPARPGGPVTQSKICPGESLVDPPEHAQWVSVGRGAEVGLGWHAGGTSVVTEQRYALLFVGDGDSIADWNDLALIYAVLLSQGFAAERMTVLAGPGPEETVILEDPQSLVYGVPEFVEGPGTRGALLEALGGLFSTVDPEAQIFMWVGGHGGREPAIPWASAIGLSPEGWVHGTLTDGSQRLDDGTPYDLFSFRGMEGDRVTVSMMSKDVDAYLWLYDDERQVLAVDDDSGGRTDARLSSSLPETGMYYVLANTYAEGETGRYSVQLRLNEDD